MQRELDVLVEQLDELLGGPVVDEDDALEVATVAGLAARLGATPEQLAEAKVWRDGVGQELVRATWDSVDAAPILEELEGVIGGGATDEQVEEALFDLDDLVAAAIWCGRRDAVRAAAREATTIVRTVPDVFVSLVDLAVTLAKLPSVARDLDLYDYWLAIADAGGTAAQSTSSTPA
jgi:hypothetical protein